mgnify:CR=1 FL=1
MKTYKLENSLDLKEVGVYPQIQEFSLSYPIKQKPYFYQGEDGRFDESIEFPVYKMMNKAKLTDLISNVPLVDNLMISSKCFKLFQNLKLPEYQIFPLKFEYKRNLIEDYLAFSIVKDIRFFNYISWEKSRFYKTLNYHKIIIEEYSLNSVDEVIKMQKEFRDSEFGLKTEIVLKYNNNYDIINFRRHPMSIGFICSELAKEEIQNAGLSGLDFVEISPELFIQK